MITGDNKYLDPYSNAQTGLPTTIQELQRLTADHPQQQSRIRNLRALIDSKFAELKETIHLKNVIVALQDHFLRPATRTYGLYGPDRALHLAAPCQSHFGRNIGNEIDVTGAYQALNHWQLRHETAASNSSNHGRSSSARGASGPLTTSLSGAFLDSHSSLHFPVRSFPLSITPNQANAVSLSSKSRQSMLFRWD
jgi:CHASE3 domain